MKKDLRYRIRQALAYLIVCAQIFAGQVYATTGTDIASSPLSQPADSIPPNIMLLFDDSGSMMFQQTPEYLSRYTSSYDNPLCFDAWDGDSAGSLTIGNTTLRNCEAGDVPVMSPDINTQFYNPEIRYQPAVNYDASDMNSMTCANTGGTVSGIYCRNGWISVPTDSVSNSTTNTFRNGTLDMMEPAGNSIAANPTSGRTTTENLATGYPDRVWCKNQSDTVTNTANCVNNSGGWAYPDATYGYGWSTGSYTKSNVKYKTGAPYYYRLATTEYCTDANFTTCVSSTVATTVGATSYSFPAKVRFCTDSTLTTCRAKWSTTYFYPKFAGNVAASSSGVTGVTATAQITVSTQSDTAAGSISGINFRDSSGTTVADLFVGTPSGSCGSVSQGASFTPTAAASAIATRIANCVSTPDLGASASSGVVTVTAPATGTIYNGYTLQVVSTVTSRVPATFTLTITGVNQANSGSNMAKLTTFSVATSPAVNFLSSSGTINCNTANCNNATSLTRKNEFASLINTAVASAVSGAAWTKVYTAGVGAVDPKIVFTAPTTTGSELNNTTVTATIGGGGSTTRTITNLAGGVSNGDIQTSTTTFSGGVTAVPFVPETRQNVGSFSRTSISNTNYCTTAARTTCVAQTTPTASYPNATYPYSQTTFTKGSARIECAASSYCTYEEEMTNFANWFTYYRSRAQMAKSAIGRAFKDLSTNFRVGYVTIAPNTGGTPNLTTAVIGPGTSQTAPSTTTPSRFLAADAFNSTQRSSWYSTLYGSTRNQTGTPNRTALARVGLYYANMNPNSMGTSPITYSCQSNYTVLVTDGYWNDSVDPWRLDMSTAIGNQDHILSVTPRPQYDGSTSVISQVKTETYTYALGALGGNSCSSTRRKIIETKVTQTVTNSYANGTLITSPAQPVTVTNAPGVASTPSTLFSNGASNSCVSTTPTLPSDVSVITNTDTTSGGAINTLADTAAYYYNTDLRTDLANEVPIVGSDTASHQHMTSFMVGLGLAGALTYDANYLTQTSGDYKNITQGTSNWPVPSADDETALDDTWHAAVNGHGQFFSAKDPSELASSLTDTLNSVSSRVGAGAAAATSNLQPVAGDNFAFTAQYQTKEWTGDLTARTIDLSTGTVASAALWSAATQLDLRTHLDRKIYTFDATDTTAQTTPIVKNGNKLKSFCWAGVDTSIYTTCTDGAGLTSTELGYFDPTSLVQALGWSADTAGRSTSATSAKLVDYLRGETANEITSSTSPTSSDLFRDRSHLLGDIISAQPAYVKSAPFNYGSTTDPYYTDFQGDTDGTTATRKGTVYVAANDGMLHAFETDPDNDPYYQDAGISTTATTDDHFTGTKSTNAITGEGAERWAYIPTMVLPNLKHIADDPYTHQYFVDGSPAVGDVCFDHTTSVPCTGKAKWHTILVGGLNAGGRGFYALDITDPDNPKGLWELKGGSDASSCLNDTQANNGTSYSDCNIGYSFGNPVIVKRKSDGKWVVLVTSGYNNFSPGNGQGYLYIIDAQTGAILNRLGTGVGCDGTSTTSPCVSGTVDPSGLARINAWVDDATSDNTALRVYGGDLKGNVWRFQLDPSGIGGVNAVYKLVSLTDGTRTQPITTKPELATVSNYPVVYVATGKLLGQTDKAGTQYTQSVYAIRDDLTNTALSPRTTGFVAQGITPISGTSMRTTTLNSGGSTNSVDFNTNKGWYIDFPDTGERGNVDPQLQLGTLVVPTNVPTTSDCTAGGYGWLNFFDYKSGTFIPGATSNMTSTKITSALVVGINVVQLPGGTVKTIVTTADNQQLSQSTPVSASSVTGRRVSWRELTVE